MSDRHSISPYPIRMPTELRAQLEAAAKDGNRSLHAEIIARLEASFSASLPFDQASLEKEGPLTRAVVPQLASIVSAIQKADLEHDPRKSAVQVTISVNVEPAPDAKRGAERPVKKSPRVRS